jgi:uncharacterized protein (UPF0335 family)
MVALAAVLEDDYELMFADSGPEAIRMLQAARGHGLDGRTLGAVVLMRDLTESKRIEEDLALRVTRLVALGVELEESTAQ